MRLPLPSLTRSPRPDVPGSWSESERAMLRELREDLVGEGVEFFALADHDKQRLTEEQIEALVTERLQEAFCNWVDERVSMVLTQLGWIPTDPEDPDEETA